MAIALAAQPVLALNDAREVLSGGQSMAQGSTLYTAPGLANAFGIDFPGPGLGKNAAAIRMPAGTLSNLRVKLVTATTPSVGRFNFIVLKNGGKTGLTCKLNGSGNCAVNINVNLANNDKLAVMATNNFTDSGLMAFTYTLEFD